MNSTKLRFKLIAAFRIVILLPMLLAPLRVVASTANLEWNLVTQPSSGAHEPGEEIVGPQIQAAGPITIQNCNFEGNLDYGIESTIAVNAESNWWRDASGPTHPSNPLGEGDAVSDNVDFDPWLGSPVDIGIPYPPYPEPGEVVLAYNSFEVNSDYGVESTVPLNAEDNWWGDASGPYHPTLNEDGQGDAVSDNVDFDPWLESPPNPPALQVVPTSLDFGDVTTELTFQIQNTDPSGGTLNWTVEEQTTWLGCESASGNTSGDGTYSGSGDETITVIVGRIGLREQVYNAGITITSNGGNVTLPVRMVVGEPQGLLYLSVASSLDASQSLAGYALVENPQDSGYEWYRVDFSLLQDETILDTYTGYADSVAAGTSAKIPFDFGSQAVGEFEVQAELYVGDGWLATETQAVSISSEAHLRAFDAGQKITDAAEGVFDHVETEGGHALAEGAVQAGKSAISLLFFVVGETVDGLEETAQIGVEILAKADAELLIFIMHLSGILDADNHTEAAEAQVATLLTPQRQAVSLRQEEYEAAVTLETFGWDSAFDDVVQRRVSQISNTPSSTWFLVPAVSPPYFSVSTFDGYVTQFEILVWILDALSVLVRILLVIAAIVFIIAAIAAIIGTGGAAAALLAVLWPVVKSLNLLKIAGGFVSLTLALGIVFMGATQVAPATSLRHDEGLDELTQAIQSARGVSFSEFETLASVDGQSATMTTSLANADSEPANPLVHTYVYNTTGALVEIIAHQPTMSANAIDTHSTRLQLMPGNYRTVSVIHTRDEIGLTSSAPALFAIADASVELTVSLADEQLEPGQVAQATIVATNHDTVSTGDLLLYAEYGDGEGAEVWTLDLAAAESETIDYEFVPSQSGLLRVRAINEWGILATRDAGYVVGSGSVLALNVAPQQVYDWGSDVQVPVELANAGDQPASAVLRWATSRVGGIVGEVYSDTEDLALAASGQDTIMTTWLPAAVPGSYLTYLYLDDVPYASFAYDVQADDTLFANVHTTALTYSAGDTVTVELNVTDSAFGAADPDNATVTVTAPDGSTQALTLSHPAIGQYEGQYTTVLSGTYIVEAVLISASDQVVPDSTYFVADQASALLPTINGDLFLQQTSPITITVLNELDWPTADASVVLSGTDTLLHEKTDALGQAGFTLLPESAEPYQLLVQKPGFAGASSQLPVRIITDTVAPPLTIILPELTNQSPLTVTGLTEPDAALVVQGESVSLDTEGRFTTTVTLSEGENLIEASATDGASNTTTESGTVTLDTVPPSLLVTAPLDATTVETETVQVMGSAEVNAQVIVDGGIVVVEPDGSFATWILLSPGSNSISVLARDLAGNEASETREVTYTVPGGEYRIYLPVVLRNHH